MFLLPLFVIGRRTDDTDSMVRRPALLPVDTDADDHDGAADDAAVFDVAVARWPPTGVSSHDNGAATATAAGAAATGAFDKGARVAA